MNAPTHPDTTASVQNHSLRLSLLLHLLPGAIATIAYLILAPIGERLGLPSFLMLLVAAVFFALSSDMTIRSLDERPVRIKLPLTLSCSP